MSELISLDDNAATPPAPEVAKGMAIGVSHLRDERQLDRLPRMLAIPFQRRTGACSYGQDADRE